MTRDLRHYVAFERAQSVYPDVMRAAKSLEESLLPQPGPDRDGLRPLGGPDGLRVKLLRDVGAEVVGSLEELLRLLRKGPTQAHPAQD